MEMDESYFQITWNVDGRRSAWLSELEGSAAGVA